MEVSKNDLVEKQWHAISAEDTASALHTDPRQGLTTSQVSDRLAEFGPNEVRQTRRKSYLKMLLSQFANPLVVVLIVAGTVTALLGDTIDSSVIFAVVIVNAIIGFVQEERAESAIQSLSNLLKATATVLRDGSQAEVDAAVLVPGDVVLLQSGGKVPADVRLISVRDLQADESILTGESLTVRKTSAPFAADSPVSDRGCMAYSGTLVTAGSAKGIVVATGDDTQLGIISDLITSAPGIVTPLTRKLSGFGKMLSMVIVGISAAVFGFGVWAGRDPAEMFTAVVAIAVAAIPEGLPAIVTIVLAVGVKRMADRHAIIRTLPAVETLGGVTVICSDKTGTLTKNEMTVREVYAGGSNFEIAGAGYDPTQCCVVAADTREEELSSEFFLECLRCGLLCNNSALVEQDGQWSPVGDPTEVALIVSAVKGGLDMDLEREAHPRIDEIPFESENMFMATLNDGFDGFRRVYVKGSVESIAEMCSTQLLQDGPAPLDRTVVLRRAEDLARQGYRVLALASTQVSSSAQEVAEDDLRDLVFLGLQAMIDPPRPEAIDAVKECQEAGIKVKMITGDHIVTARYIARSLAIASGEDAVTGRELAALEGEDFDRTACATSVFARVAPEQKYRLVESLQAHGDVVAMTGDGVNDAPALKKADVGVAMGQAGSEVAKDAADIVLTDDNFATIVAAVEEGRTVFGNLLKSLVYILPTNAGEGLVILAAILIGATLPITPVQILWINTITAVALALPLAFEPREPGTMARPPRNPASPLLSKAMLSRIVLVALVLVAGAFTIFRYELSVGATIAQARTAAVATVVGFELFYLFSARSERLPIWRMNLFGNPYVWIGALLVIVLQLGFTYLPIANRFFGSAPIEWEVWLRVLLVSVPVVPIVAIDKTLRARFGRSLDQDGGRPERTCQ